MTKRTATAGAGDALAGQFAEQFAGYGAERFEAPDDVANHRGDETEANEPDAVAANEAAAGIDDDEELAAGAASEPEGEPGADDPANADPTIVPPAGMTEADRQAFAELPENLKRFVMGQEASRTADYGRKTQELDRTRRETEALQGELRVKLAQEIEALQAVAGKELAPPDPGLKREDPERYEAELAGYLHGKHAQERAEGRLAEALQERARQQMAAYREFVDREAARLPELIPEMADPAKADGIAGEIRAYALERGYGEAELIHAGARDLGVLHKAMLFDRAQAARSKAERRARRAPKSQKPGAATSASGSRRQRFAELLEKHDKAGSVSTMASLFEENLRGR